MSSTTSSTPAAVLAPPQTAAPIRKFPLPCWTHDETVALIDAYRERWISLRRGYLRTVDWEAVAATVASKCGHIESPIKSSDQCRHKMEKLRQRYRAEKQRCVAVFPGKFSSGWMFFKGLSFLDDVGSAATEGKKRSLVAKGAGAATDSVADVSPSDMEDGFFLTALGDRKFTIDLKNFVKIDEKFQNPNSGFRRNFPFPVENIPAERLRKFARTEMPPSLSKQNHIFNSDDDFHENSTFMKSDKSRTPTGYTTFSTGRNKIFNTEEEAGFNFNTKVSGKFHNSINKSNFVKNNYRNSENSLNDDSSKRNDPLAEMAESIKQMGDGFLKMEKMRLEMALEFEKARMEMEMKRNEMIVDSHKRIVEAFVNVAERMKSEK